MTRASDSLRMGNASAREPGPEASSATPAHDVYVAASAYRRGMYWQRLAADGSRIDGDPPAWIRPTLAALDSAAPSVAWIVRAEGVAVLAAGFPADQPGAGTGRPSWKLVLSTDRHTAPELAAIAADLVDAIRGPDEVALATGSVAAILRAAVRDGESAFEFTVDQSLPGNLHDAAQRLVRRAADTEDLRPALSSGARPHDDEARAAVQAELRSIISGSGDQPRTIVVTWDADPALFLESGDAVVLTSWGLADDEHESDAAEGPGSSESRTGSQQRADWRGLITRGRQMLADPGDLVSDIRTALVEQWRQRVTQGDEQSPERAEDSESKPTP